MSEERVEELIEKATTFRGEGFSVRMLEETIHEERTRQKSQVVHLKTMRSNNDELQRALAEEVAKLRDLSKALQKERATGAQGGWRDWFSFLPGVESTSTRRRSVEELLRNQYEVSALRLKEAAEFADRLDVAKSDLYDEIDRLHEKIILYAENEAQSARFVVDLSATKTELEHALDGADPSSVEARKLQAQLDRVRRSLAEQSGLLKLYDRGEERLIRLQENTRLLAETIGHLQTDISTYVTIAGEKLDLVSGQIQAIGAAADAGIVMLELKRSLESLTDSVNHTTRFVAETQAYFRDHVDSMVDALAIYDEETERVLQESTSLEEAFDEMQVADALSLALSKEIDAAAAAANIEVEAEEEVSM